MGRELLRRRWRGNSDEDCDEDGRDLANVQHLRPRQRLKLDQTSIDCEVAVVEQHRPGDTVAQQVERQLVLGIGALVAGGEEGEAHAPRRLVAQQRRRRREPPALPWRAAGGRSRR